MRKLKIISDGTAMGSKVIDVKSGEAIEGIASIMWNIGIDDSEAMVTLQLINVECEVKGKG